MERGKTRKMEGRKERQKKGKKGTEGVGENTPEKNFWLQP